MGILSVAVLGRTEVGHAGAPLTLPTRKALALLVYLAAEGGLHRRELSGHTSRFSFVYSRGHTLGGVAK